MQFNDKTIEQLSRNLVELHSELDQLFPEYAKAKTEFENLEEWKKNIYYSVMPESGTEIQRKKVAETSEAYEMHIEGLNAARGAYNEAMAKKTSLIMKIETIRTIISAKKEEVRNFGG